MCFSLAWLAQLFIWLIIVGAVYAIIKLLLPMVLANFGPPGNVILQVLNIIMWAMIAIFIVYLCFDLISCLGGISLPRVGR